MELGIEEGYYSSNELKDFLDAEEIEEDFIEISSCQELQNMKNNLTANYKLVSDVNCIGFDFELVGEEGMDLSCLMGYEREVVELHEIAIIIMIRLVIGVIVIV